MLKGQLLNERIVRRLRECLANAHASKHLIRTRQRLRRTYTRNSHLRGYLCSALIVVGVFRNLSWVVLLVYATCLIRPHLFDALFVVSRITINLLHHSPLLKNTCVRHVVLEQWFPLNV